VFPPHKTISRSPAALRLPPWFETSSRSCLPSSLARLGFTLKNYERVAGTPHTSLVFHDPIIPSLRGHRDADLSLLLFKTVCIHVGFAFPVTMYECLAPFSGPYKSETFPSSPPYLKKSPRPFFFFSPPPLCLIRTSPAFDFITNSCWLTYGSAFSFSSS